MRKRFNVSGSCNPERQYMVKTEKRFKAIEELIDNGEYFTINRARQYGKTTMLDMIRQRISNRFNVILFNCKDLDTEVYQYGKELHQSCKDSLNPTILLVDDADKANNQLSFVDFSGFLRNEYLERDKYKAKHTFHSVVLACEQDVRNIVTGIRAWTSGPSDESYLVTFDFSKNKQEAEPQWIEWNGKRGFEVVV